MLKIKIPAARLFGLLVLSGSGKTTIANNLKEKLNSMGKTVEILDGDVIRNTLHKELSFSREDIKKTIS